MGQLAEDLGWPAAELARMPADDVERLLIVNDCYQDYLEKQREIELARMRNNGPNHAGTR